MKFLLALFILQIPFLALYFYRLVEKYHIYCPNREFLGWDANLRMTTTLDTMDSLRNFDILLLLKTIFDSPTWPVLRNLLEAAFFFITSPQPDNDVYFTLLTFLLLFACLACILVRYTDRHWSSALLFAVFCIWVFQSQPILLYSFSGMLEIQGALFVITSSYLLYLLLTATTAPKNNWLLFLSFQLLYHTKYPYGYMFLLASAVFYLLLYPRQATSIASSYLLHLRKSRTVWVLAVLVALYFLFPQQLAHGKGPKYFKYLLFLGLSIHVLLWFAKERVELSHLDQGIFVSLFWTLALPILVWTMIHPDRFSSSSGTISHIQSEGLAPGIVAEKNLQYFLFYLREMQSIVFSNTTSWMILALFFLALAKGSLALFHRVTPQASFFLAGLAFLQILMLTFFTQNHQARHIYHLYPAIFLAGLLLLFEQKNFRHLLVLPLFALATGYFALTAGATYQKTHVCFSGIDTEPYRLPRWIRQNSGLLTENSIIYNYINPLHVNKSDAEMRLSIAAYEKNIRLLFDPRNFHSVNGYREMIFLGNDCGIKNNLQRIHPQLLKASPQLVAEIRGEGCILKYKLHQ